MVTFERMLFDYNEHMHHSGKLAEDAYIDGTDLLLQWSVAVIIVMLYIYYVHPIVIEKVMKIKVSESSWQYIKAGLILSYITYLYLEHMYGLLMVLTIIFAVLYIIFTNKRLIRVKEFIEDLF